MLKVLFAAMRWDYKDPARGDSFEYTNFWNCLQHMDGIEAELFPFDEIESKVGLEGMNAALLEKVAEWRPDVVFFFMFIDEFNPEVVRKVGAMAPTVNWFADDQWRFRGYSRYWAEHLTWVATTYEPAVAGYQRLGHKNVIKTQWACNHYLYKPVPVGRDLEVTFVGQPHGDRKQIIDRIRAAGIPVQTWGMGWESGRIGQQEMIELFSRTKVNLNLSNASHPTGLRNLIRPFVRKAGPVFVPKFGHLTEAFWEIRSKQKDQIKGRNFEIPGCRTLLLASRVEGLEEYYEFEKEIATFEGEQELLDKIRHYLEDDESREQVAGAGYERTIRDHTYDIRFREIFSKMGLW